MGFEITTLKESEIDEFNDVIWEAFGAATDPTSERFYPGGHTPEIQAQHRGSVLKALPDPTTEFIIIRDGDTKAMVAAARWHYQTEDVSMQAVDDEAEKQRSERAAQTPIEGINFVAIDRFREAQYKAKREVLQGKAHVRLGTLATHPEHQRQGAGAAALSWGLQKADALGLPVYLEASAMGKPLYLKYGLKDALELPLDVRQHANWCMLRDAVNRGEGK